MGQAFNEWAQSVEGQNAIKSFIEYTEQNLPLIGQIFGSTFRGIFNLMKAFAPNTHLVLQGLADMANQSNNGAQRLQRVMVSRNLLNMFKRTDLNLSNY